MEKLLLFDVDGTLVDTEGAGLLSLQDGVYDAFPHLGGETFPPLDLGGATDGSVVAFLFEEFGVENHEENRAQFYESYLEALASRLREFTGQGKGRVLEGVIPLLEHLRENRPEWTLGLLTGNAARGALAKLSHYQLDHFFLFGAYGDDHADRNALGPIALERASRDHELEFSPADVVIIGDTHKDISCARAFGAHALAVATGSPTVEDLARAKPDILLESFGNLPQVVDAIGSLFVGQEG
ncbi:MAG: HAD hydrolase-like protein [Verrucomicrobiota bacterium]